MSGEREKGIPVSCMMLVLTGISILSPVFEFFSEDGVGGDRKRVGKEKRVFMFHA